MSDIETPHPPPTIFFPDSDLRMLTRKKRRKRRTENSSWGSLTNSREKELQVLTRLFCVLEGGMTGKIVFPALLSGILNLELTSVRENMISCTSSLLFPTISVVEEGGHCIQGLMWVIASWQNLLTCQLWLFLKTAELNHPTAGFSRTYN